MTALLDVNVLVALAWPNHIHHRIATTWFRSERDLGWATCPVTESGFVRVSSNPRISDGLVTPSAAIDLLLALRKLGRHEFLVDSVSLAASPEVRRDRIHGYRQVTDAHLLALAVAHGGRLATLDRGVLELGQPDAVQLLDS